MFSSFLLAFHFFLDLGGLPQYPDQIAKSIFPSVPRKCVLLKYRHNTTLGEAINGLLNFPTRETLKFLLNEGEIPAWKFLVLENLGCLR